MLTSKKVFSLLRLGGLPLLMSLVLILVIGVSSVQAQAVDTLGPRAAKTYVTLSNKAVQDSVLVPNFSLLVGDTLTTTSDTVVISFAGPKFLFAQKGPYPVVVNGTVVADSARVNAGGTSLFIKITGPVSGSFDTLTLSSVYIKGLTTSALAFSDSTATDSMAFTIGRAPSGYTTGAHNGNTIVLLPAPIYNISSAILAATTATAGSSFNAGTLNCTDRWGNIPYDKTTTVAIAALLNTTTTPGNGTLSGTNTKTAVAGHPGTCTQAWTAEKYTKAEPIQLKYTPAGASLTSAAIVVSPGAAANISAVVQATYSESITVDQTIQYTLTVTDANFNPVANGTTVTWAENTPHGGAGSSVGGPWTTTNGQIATALFTPSKFFIGPDTLLFSSGTATLLRPIAIAAGSLGGLLVDYAGTATGSATTEDIGAGQSVYVRGFLRDTYGNPIDATSASQITFTISGKNGKNTSLGAAALTSSITESQYPNTNKSAVAIAVPYKVSSNYRAASADSILAVIGGYSATAKIQNRSDVPATVKIVQSIPGDSSLVVSNYANSTTYSDTVWDQYSNVVTAPSSSYKVAPLRAAYAMYMKTFGKAGFPRLNDTTVVDTLYPSSGIVNRTVASSKTAGLDTLKTWSAANASVAAAVPVWITPATYAKVAIIPHVDTTAIAGKVEVFKIEKQDTYGNHIDWGFSGGQARGNSPAAFAKPSAAQILSDSTALVVDTVSSGHNRGGVFVKSTTTGSVGAASVNGSLNLLAKYTPYTVTADTQKIYVSLTGFNDTVQVRSISTGALNSFVATIAAADSVKNAGDSVKVVVTAYDGVGNRIYSYKDGAQVFSVNNTSVASIATKDTTFYFSYANSRGQYVKSTGAAIPDTVFVQGQATLYLHKFVAEGVNTVSIAAGAVTATSANGSLFKPLTSVGQTTWSVTCKDTVTVGVVFSYTITPRDMYYNVNTTVTNFASVSTNQGVNFDAGANPKIFIGPTTYTASQAVVTNNLIIIVSNGTSTINGQSKSIVVIPAVVNATVSGTVAYASTAANAISAVTVTLTPATGTALTATSNATGAYSIANVPAGTYTLTASKTGGWGGVNSTDALVVARHSAGISLLTGLPLVAGDVNNSATVNNTDALLIVRRSVGLDASFVGGDWTFQSQPVTVTTTNVTANISGLCMGDVNASYTPSSGTVFAKSVASSISLKSGSDKFSISGSSAAAVGAVSMRINVNSAEVANISSKLQGFVSNVDEKGVTIGWFAQDGQAVQFGANEAIVTVTLKDKATDKSNIVVESDLADIAGAKIDNSLTLAKDIPTVFELSQNYPNPFNPSTQINYDLPKAGMVTLSVYNMLGQEVARIVNEQKEAGSYTVTWAPRNLASGVYIYRLHVQTEKDAFTSVKRLTLLK